MLRPEGVASRDVILLSICKAVSHMDNPLIDISDTSNSKKLPSTEFKWHAILNFIQHSPGSHLRKIKKELNISMEQFNID